MHACSVAIAQCLVTGIILPPGLPGDPIIGGRTANTLDGLLATAVVPGLARSVNTARSAPVFFFSSFLLFFFL